MFSKASEKAGRLYSIEDNYFHNNLRSSRRRWYVGAVALPRHVARVAGHLAALAAELVACRVHPAEYDGIDK